MNRKIEAQKYKQITVILEEKIKRRTEIKQARLLNGRKNTIKSDKINKNTKTKLVN